MKLALGTVQFGQDYGAFGRRQRVVQAEVSSILRAAIEADVDLLDTASMYGSAEGVLGELAAGREFDIVSKCPALSAHADPVAVLFESANQSRRALGVDRLYGYLLHNASDISLPGVWEGLKALRDRGHAARIGVSAYGYDEVLQLSGSYALGLVQLPGNVLDPWYESAKLPAGLEVHVRSVFLQGFLLADPGALPERFLPWKSTLVAFCRRAEELGLSQIQAAVIPLLQAPAIDRVVVGVDSLAHFGRILTELRRADLDKKVEVGPLPGVSAELTDPRRWSSGAMRSGGTTR